ncbi:type I polyketide synthase [Streptomyces griseochromogenes]|uniref:type I polyketide synthase n=1 Tax=Streptomyces griseochromogenes TaxID=68214 RepID=UPI0037ABCCEA
MSDHDLTGHAPADCDVAVIGMACRFPGADSVTAFWRLLRDGREATVRLTDEQLVAAGAEPDRPGFVRAAQLLPGVDLFDAEHFRIPPEEAELIDPQQRHFLECALAALEDSGYDPFGYPGEIGVFGGAGMNTYLLANLADRYRGGTALGRYRLMLTGDKDFLTTRVSYKLDLRGPSVSVGTACSTSLVAVHQACLSLLAGECAMALAGAVHVRLPQDEGYVHQDGMIFSPDGRCRAFDADARGTVLGSGVGIVVLKPLTAALAEGDTVHAVIKGTAVNNDGAAKTGFTAPSVERQAAVIREAQRAAGCPPETIGYVEAHGTGTPLGDPIEVAALNRAFGPTGAGRTVLGSVKTNVGHLDAAAGMAGLIKTVLMLRHRTLVPSLHFRTPNPDIDFAAGPFRVGTEPAEWSNAGGPRRAGVSSFGVGGTNAHVVLEEPPAAPAAAAPREAELLVVSARAPEALERATGALARRLRQAPGADLAAVAHTLAVGRRPHRHRRAVVCADAGDAALALALLDPGRVRTGRSEERPAAFAFVLPDGSGLPGAERVYRESGAFREVVDECAALLGEPAAALLGDGPVAAFAVPYALARVCLSAGVRPSALVGLGRGGLVAGCLAGVFAPERALALAAGRGGTLRCAEPRLPVGLGAGWLRSDQAVDPDRWLRPGPATGDRQAVATMLKEADLVPLGFEPSPAAGSAGQVLLDVIGLAWTHGAEIDWSHCYGPERRRRVPLPTYPYQRRRHWVDPPSGRTGPQGATEPSLRRRVEEADAGERSDILREFLCRHLAGLLESDALPGPDQNLFDLGADSLMLLDAVATVGIALDRAVPSSLENPPTIRALADRVAATWENG